MKTFTHLALPKLPTLTRKNIDGSRVYETESGDRYPSVTTVLSVRGKKAIYEWRQRVGSEVADQISKKATVRGTKVHACCESYLKNEPLPELNLIEKEMWTKFAPVLDRIDNIHYIEAFLYSDHLGIAGQVDCIAEFDGRLSVIDFKTSKRVKRHEDIPGYFAQCAAYAIMYEERTGTPINRSVILMAVDDEEPLVFIDRRDPYVPYLLESKRMYENGQYD
jgi:genome maintenance exonuclease 1